MGLRMELRQQNTEQHTRVRFDMALCRYHVGLTNHTLQLVRGSHARPNTAMSSAGIECSTPAWPQCGRGTGSELGVTTWCGSGPEWMVDGTEAV